MPLWQKIRERINANRPHNQDSSWDWWGFGSLTYCCCYFYPFTTDATQFSVVDLPPHTFPYTVFFKPFYHGFYSLGWSCSGREHIKGIQYTELTQLLVREGSLAMFLLYHIWQETVCEFPDTDLAVKICLPLSANRYYCRSLCEASRATFFSWMAWICTWREVLSTTRLHHKIDHYFGAGFAISTREATDFSKSGVCCKRWYKALYQTVLWQKAYHRYLPGKVEAVHSGHCSYNSPLQHLNNQRNRDLLL